MSPGLVSPEDMNMVTERSDDETPPTLLNQPTKNIPSAYVVNEEPIHTPRPLRIVCMGAGYSGLMMGIIFAEELATKNTNFVMYERNNDLGGTWLENRYHGRFTSSI